MSQNATSLIKSADSFYAQHQKDAPSLIAGASVVLVIVLALIGYLFAPKGKKKEQGILGRARFATAQELERSNRRSAKVVKKLVNGGQHNRVALWIRMPAALTVDHKTGRINVPFDPRTLYLRKLQEMVLVLGSTGSGKSFSILDPLMRAAILLGLPICTFDYKGYEEDPSETGTLAPSSVSAGIALNHGYKVYVIGPGYADSDKLNLLSLVDNPEDVEGAYDLGSCLSENIKLAGDVPPDFFSLSSDQLLQAIFQYVKSLLYGADLATCHKILALPNLIKRLQAADLPQYVKTAFDQYLSSCDSPETAASIATTVAIILSRFMTKSISAVFCGQTTIPLDLTGRVMVIFRLNPRVQKSVMPLIAASFYALIIRNIYQPRKDPICFFLDEFSRFKLLNLGTLLNVARSNGGLFFLGGQSISGIRAIYGEDETNNILGGCKTQIIGQLNVLETAKYYQDLLENEDIEHEQKSKGKGKGGSSTNQAEQLSTRPLVSIPQWTSLTEGEFYFINPGVASKTYKGKTDGSLPFFRRVEIPKEELEIVEAGKKRWREERKIRIARNIAKPLTEADLMAREAMVADLLPMPQKVEASDSGQANESADESVLTLVKVMF